MIRCRNFRRTSTPLQVIGFLLVELCLTVAAVNAVRAAEFPVNGYTTGPQVFPGVAVDSGGSFVVIWSGLHPDDSSGVRARRFDSEGSPLGTEFQVNTNTTGYQSGNSVAADADGDFVVVWSDVLQDISDSEVVGQRFSSAGMPVGTEFQINTYTTGLQLGARSAADADGDFVVVWGDLGGQDGSGIGIFGQRFNSAGALAGTEFQVNSYATGNQLDADVAGDADGDFVVVWTGVAPSLTYGILGQRFGSGGAPVGTEFQINSYTTGMQNYPSVSMDTDGDFVVVWYGAHDGSLYGVFGQRFSSTGAFVGTEFQVNGYTTSTQYRVRVSADNDGDFVVVWQSYGQDGDNQGVFGRRYASNGSPIAGEFRVHSDPAGAQTFPAVSADPELGFVVAWNSVEIGDYYGGDIFATRVRASGCPASPQGGCTSGFAKGFLLVKETPGAEKLIAKLINGPAIAQLDFGNPLFGVTAYNLCIYDDVGSLAGEVTVDRASDMTCSGGIEPCWAAIGQEPPDPNGKGYKYKDQDGSADGIAKVLLKGGDAGKTKALVKGKGGTLPLPIAPALTTTNSVTIQLLSNDGDCFTATLSDIKTQQSDSFKAK